MGKFDKVCVFNNYTAMKRKFRVVRVHVFSTIGRFASILSKIKYAIRLRHLIASSRSNGIVSQSAVVDGTWDNPNYWMHVAIVAASRNIDFSCSSALMGPYSRLTVRWIARFLGIGRSESIDRFYPTEEELKPIVDSLLRGTRTPEDVLTWKLPESFPATSAYDTILKLQRGAFVDPLAPDFKEHVTRCIRGILATKRYLTSVKPEVVLCSHNLGEIAAPLAWNAIRQHVPTFVLYGDFGGARYLKLEKEADFQYCMTAPTPEEIESCSPDQRLALKENGQNYLEERFGGVAGDIGSTYAHQKSSVSDQINKVYQDLGWSADKPIVSVYMQNWYDFPNSFGLRNFRDFHDWATEVLKVAGHTNSVNWLIRAHPLDVWYGVKDDVSVRKLVESLGASHVRLCPDNVSSQAVMRMSSGITTACGTIGVEAPANGIPVLVCEDAWYGKHAFVCNPGSRQNYIETLATQWWSKVDVDGIRVLAEIFAGFYFGYPSWQKGYIFEDTSLKENLYPGLYMLMDHAGEQIKKEIELLQRWYVSAEPRYHVYKNLQENEFIHASRTNSYIEMLKDSTL